MSYRYTNQSGQSLIELLIAMGVFVLVISGIMFLTLDAHSANRQGGERTKATLLAQEGVEAATSLKNRSWKKLAVGDHGLAAGTVWEFSGSSDSVDKFTRQVGIELVQRDQNGAIVENGGAPDFDTRKVTSKITWDFQPDRPSEVAITAYMTNWRSAKWVQTTQAEFDQGTKNGVVSANASGGELVLESAQGFLGNRFLVEGMQGVGSMTSALMKTSFRFTAQASRQASALAVYLHQEVGQSPTYRYGLQKDNAGSPDGIWLGATNRGYGDFRATATGWQTINLNETVGLEEGSVYHLVIQWQTGTIGTNRYISLRASTPLNNLVAYNNVPEPNSLSFWSTNGGLSWAAVTAQPIFQLISADGTAEGNPYDSLASVNVYGGRFAGELFTVQGSDKQISDVGFYVRKNNSALPNPLDDLYVVVEDAANGTVVERGTLASHDTIAPTYAWRTYAFANPLTLATGRRYRVYLTSPLSNNQRYYQVYRLNNQNQNTANAINYDGLNSLYVASSNSGSSWTTTNNADIGGFQFTVLSGYLTAGDFVSAPFDTQNDATLFNYVAWTSSLPIGTTFWLQLRTARLPGELTTALWFGPDGTNTTYFTQPGEVIPDTPSTRWVQYKLYLSSDGIDTPILSDITLDYE